jgi:hypothetical protein
VDLRVFFLLHESIGHTAQTHGIQLLDRLLVEHDCWTPRVSLSFLIQQVKGTTAFHANQLLKRVGEPFWQPEYFDRLVRSEGEFVRIRRYIEWNPVKEGLVARPEEYPWSSAWGRD